MSKIFKKIIISPWTALLTLALCASVRIADPAFVESMRLRYFDTLITGAEVKVSEQVHLVNIDDAAIEKLGQFPFPRGQYANIIKDLYQRNAGLVVFNIFMPDADRAGQDAVLASALKQMPTVLPHTATNDDVRSSVPPFRPGVSVIGSGEPGIPYRHIQPNVRSINDPSVSKPSVLPPATPLSRLGSTTESLKPLEFRSLEKFQQTILVESGWIGHPDRPNIPWLICQRTSKVELLSSDLPRGGSTTPSQLLEEKSIRTSCKPL